MRLKPYSTLMFFFYQTVYCQTFIVHGNISANTAPVKYASVTFINQNDATNKYSTLTDNAGNYQFNITSVEPPGNLPVKFELKQNYPNPFSSTISISYKLNEQSTVSIRIFNILGQVVKEFTMGKQIAGMHGIVWDGKDRFGNRLASGIYFYQLRTIAGAQVKKMIYGINDAAPQLQLISQSSFLTKMSSPKIVTEVTTKTFIVRITNTSSTSPKIISTEFSNVVVNQDTTLNYQAQEAINAYSLCYERQDTISYNNRNDYLTWAIHLNNNTGTNPKTIINSPWNSEYPSWSPDGKYIAIMRENSDGVNLYLYDTAVDTLRQLTTSGRINSGTPIWTTDNKKIVYGYIGPQNNETHIIDVDGSNDRKLLINPSDLGVSFLYPDNYTCLFEYGTKLYKTNLDTTFKEFIIDLQPSSSQYVTIRDFNPLTGDLFVNTNVTSDLSEVIATFNVETKQFNVLLTADKGYELSMQRFSRDNLKIVFSEMNTNGYTEEYLSILENGVKRRLIRLSGGQAGGDWFDYNPMQFSPDGKYVAFSKNVTQTGSDFFWKSYLDVVNATSGELQYIDMGFSPVWNPKIAH